MHDHIFGGAGSILHARDKFAGYGRPDFTSLVISTANTLGGYIDVDFTVNVGGLTTTVVVEYAEDTGVPPATWTTYGSYNYASNGTYNIEFPVPNTSDNYFVRIKSYNLFTVDDDIYENGAGGTVVSSSAPANDPLQLSLLTFITTDILGEQWIHTWNYPSATGSFTLEVSINGSGFTTADCQILNPVYEGSNLWSGRFSLNVIPTVGHTVVFRIKRAGTTEPWTSTQEFNYHTVEEQNATEPAVSTSAATSVTAGGATLNGSITAFDPIQTENYDWWYQWKKTVDAIWNQTSPTQASNTGSKPKTISGLDDGTQYDFRIVAQHMVSTALNVGSTLTFTTTALSPHPTSVSFVDNGANSQVTWTTPAAGNPGSYTINITVNGGTKQNITSGLSGSSTSHTFDICAYAANGDNVVLEVVAVSPSGSGSSSSSSVTSFCF